MEVKITQKIGEQDKKMEDALEEFKRAVMTKLEEMLNEQNTKIEDQEKKILSQEETIALQNNKISKQDEKIAEYEETLAEYNRITGKTIEAFKTEVRGELATKFTQQEKMITKQSQTAGESFETFTTEVREEVQNKISEQEEIVNEVSQLSGIISRVVAFSHPEFPGISEILGDVSHPHTHPSMIDQLTVFPETCNSFV